MIRLCYIQSLKGLGCFLGDESLIHLDINLNQRMPFFIQKYSFSDCNNSYLTLLLLTLQKGKVKPVHVVDVPGHARLKPKLDEFLPRAAGVVFVVDAQDFLSSMQAAAE